MNPGCIRHSKCSWTVCRMEQDQHGSISNVPNCYGSVTCVFPVWCGFSRISDHPIISDVLVRQSGTVKMGLNWRYHIDHSKQRQQKNPMMVEIYAYSPYLPQLILQWTRNVQLEARENLGRRISEITRVKYTSKSSRIYPRCNLNTHYTNKPRRMHMKRN